MELTACNNKYAYTYYKGEVWIRSDSPSPKGAATGTTLAHANGPALAALYNTYAYLGRYVGIHEQGLPVLYGMEMGAAETYKSMTWPIR